MGLFGRKDKVIDLSEGYHTNRKGLEMLKARHSQQPQQSLQAQQSSSVSDGLSFLGGLASSSTTVDDIFDSGVSVDERKKKLAKRLMDMTNKIEDLSNQIYHLQQRIEVLERKFKLD